LPVNNRKFHKQLNGEHRNSNTTGNQDP